ncbi:DUF1269 domain-containing protein [uncultured Thiothrix sp.]|uniref:DUF1269 domain-containing protein n=1 Tax=uncultured Thiothrix sp. TaxID=223185 RepID=UPI00261A4BC5|nr:DUF1269 domain-containing protein [uncultured Thiothrix sp.]
MSTLVAIGFDDEKTAFAMREKLVSMQKEYLIEMEDAVVVTKSAEGKIKLHQAVNLTTAGAVGGSFWGMLIGMLFLSPLLGAAVGAGTGALTGALSDIGIEDNFMKELASSMQTGQAMLFVLVRRATTDKVLEGLKGFHGRIIQTSLAKDQEDQLRQVLSAPAIQAHIEAQQQAAPAVTTPAETSTPSINLNP